MAEIANYKLLLIFTLILFFLLALNHYKNKILKEKESKEIMENSFAIVKKHYDSLNKNNNDFDAYVRYIDAINILKSNLKIYDKNSKDFDKFKNTPNFKMFKFYMDFALNKYEYFKSKELKDYQNIILTMSKGFIK